MTPFDLTLAALALAAIGPLVRLVRGPTMVDRLLAVHGWIGLAALAIAAEGARTNAVTTVLVGLALCVAGFVAVIAVAGSLAVPNADKDAAEAIGDGTHD